MKYFILACALAWGSYTGLAQIQKTENKKELFLLGTFHFASNNDRIKQKFDDMLSDKRQKEIEELVAGFAEFKPDKICIEWKARDRQRETDSLYQLYVRGDLQLKANEVYQIAFRLAKKLGHKKVYCIDAPGSFLYDTLLSTAKQYHQLEWFTAHDNLTVKIVQKQDSLRKLRSLKETLKQINSPTDLQFGLDANEVFVSQQLGEPGEYAGAEFVGEWYKRNIRMCSNIIRVAEPGDKRIFVIVGSGHKSVMKHFFETNPGWTLTDVIQYLK